MQSIKRIEIITDAVEMREVRRVLARHGIAGYTIIRDVEGQGLRGAQTGDDLTDVFKNSYLLTTCEPAQLDALVAAIRPILKKRGGICLVSDAQWVTH
jgi:nitrogen regulatory protein PII